MGNACESYCSYEEQSQLNFYQKGEFMTEKSKVQYTTKKSNKSMAQMKSMKSPEEKSTYFLRGMGPSHNSSPVRQSVKAVSRVESPERQELKIEEPPIVVSPPKQKRIRKIRGDKFPFEYLPTQESEFKFADDYIYSQKLQVTNNLHARNANFSPRRERTIKDEEKLAFYLNNIAISERCLRPPSLANEIIMTHNEIRREPEKRLKTRDAGIQSVEKGYKSDVSTTTDITPMKREIPEPPPVIQEIVKKPKKKPVKKAPVQEEQNVHEVIIDPDEEILLEGEMLKFKPGIEKNFITRWIQLSTRSFRYYKNHYHSICYLTRPISAIPLYAIEAVQTFAIANQDYKRREKESYSFLFEIVLKQDYEDIFFFREFEVTGLGNSQTNSPIRTSGSPGRRSVREGSDPRNSLGRRSRSPNRYTIQNHGSNGQMVVTSQHEINGQMVPTRMVYISPNRQSESPSTSVMKGGDNSKVTRIIQGHLMPVRDQNKGLQKEHYLEDQKIIDKEFGEPQVNVHGDKQIYTWSNRQKEWYNSERRFIFSCKSDAERKKWMAAIRMAVVENNERLRREFEENQKLSNDNQSQVKYMIQSQKVSTASKFDSPSKSPVKGRNVNSQVKTDKRGRMVDK